MISIIIPANNEEGYIGECLQYLLQSVEPQAPVAADADGQSVQIIVVANGCKDGTVMEVSNLVKDVTAKGWHIDIVSLVEGSKIKALNEGDKVAVYESRIYLDADIHVSPGLIAGIVKALNRPEPAFVSGCPTIRSAKSPVSERYARFWERLPFMEDAVAGCGVYCVNGAGRARWQEFPDVISDDTFVRYHFSDDEMHKVPYEYSWPVTENFRNLVKVRRRQNEGLREIRALMADVAAATERTRPNPSQTLKLFARDPIGFMVYASVAATVRTPIYKNHTRWERGR